MSYQDLQKVVKNCEARALEQMTAYFELDEADRRQKSFLVDEATKFVGLANAFALAAERNAPTV